MKLILLSDIHLVTANPISRTDDLTQTQWDKLKYVFNYAVESNIHNILQAGDFVDKPRSWELLEKLSLFLTHYKNQGVDVYTVMGQHDTLFHNLENQKTTMGILSSSKIVNVLNKKAINLETISIYGSSWGENVPVVENKNHTNILVIHKQIGTSKIFDKQENFIFADKFLKENLDYNLILCGDCHQSFISTVNKKIICNTGSMLRKESSEYNFKHAPHFYVYDTYKNKLEGVTIPHSLAVSVLSTNHLEQQKIRQDNFDDFICRVQQTDQESSISFEENLKFIIEKYNASEQVKNLIHHYFERTNQ